MPRSPPGPTPPGTRRRPSLAAALACALALPAAVRGAEPSPPAGGSAAPAAPACDPADPAARRSEARLALASPLLACPPLAGEAVSGLRPLELERPRDGRRVQRDYGLAALESAGFTAGMVAWNRFIGKAKWANVTPSSIATNTRRAWGLDDDQWWVNQFGHPYQGAFTFQAARSAGLGFWTSSGYTFVASAVWEIAAETERPSINDQITTTLGGVVFGEIFHRLAASLHEEGGTWNAVFATVLDPFQSVNRRLLGTPVEERPPLRWLAATGASARTDVQRGETARNLRVAAQLVSGVPGDPDLRLERPLDHFVLDVAYGAATDPQVSLRSRGLLLGTRFDAGERTHGVWGLFLSLDFDSPGPFRTSSTGVGLGASARTELPRALALEWAAVASAVPIGGAGRVPRAPGLEERDYVLGPGAQGLAEATLFAGDRVRAGLAFRQWAILGAESRQGDELVLEGSALLVVRVAGRHGVGAELRRSRRFDRDPAGDVARASAGMVHVFWSVAGGPLSSGFPAAR
jgi:hypothetical protein